MIELVRFVKTMDREDVPLNEDIWEHGCETYESGDWLVPVGQGVNTPKTSGWMEMTEAVAANLVDDIAQSTQAAKLVWFEKGRPDSKYIHKYTVIHGSETRIKTDRFDEKESYAPGMKLTLKPAAASSKHNGKYVLAPAGSGDVVKAICWEDFKLDKKELLTFELV